MTLLFPGRHWLRTIQRFEAAVEAIEAVPEPFTIDDVWHAYGGHYSIARTAVNELREHGLIVKVNEGFIPLRYVRVRAAS